MVLMPDSNPSLPQIPKQESTQALPPEGVNVALNPVDVPKPSDDLASAENSVLSPPAGGIKSMFSPKKVVAIFVLILVIVVSYFVYFVWLPSSQQDDYVLATYGDYSKLKEGFASAQGENAALKGTYGALEVSKGAYFDISQSLVYVYSVSLEDSRQKLDQVKSFQTNVSDIRKAREKHRVGAGVKKLDGILSEYLAVLDKGLNGLYALESSKVDIFNAIGEDFGREIDKLLGVYNTATSREEKITYVENLLTISGESAERLRKLERIPDDLRVYLDMTVESHEDLSATLGEMKKDYEAGSEEGDREAIQKLSKFGERQLARNGKVQAESERVVRESSVKKEFDKALELEGQLESEFDALREKFGLTR